MADKGRTQKVREYTRKPKGAFDTNQIMFYGGLVALAGVAVGGYYWMSSITAAQQAQSQLTAAQTPGQGATANASASAGGGVYPAVLPGTAIITQGAVDPLGAFRTIFPIFGGQQFFTLTRRSCDPVLGGVPSQADLASQGIVITSYQINNVGPVAPSVCGVPRLSITVGTTDPSSAIKLQALGFIPGAFGPPIFGGALPFIPPWPRPLAPIGGYPHNVPPVFPGVIPPYPVPRPVTPVPLPVPVQPWWYPYRFPKRKWGHDRDDGKHRNKPVHIIGFPKHNFIKPVGHVLNFESH